MLELVNEQRLLEFGQGLVPPHAMRLDESLPLPAAERLAWERRLNRQPRSCGCTEGAVGLSVGLGIVLIASFVQTEPWTTFKAAAAVGLPVGLLIAGKLAGRALSHRRFRNTCRQLLSRLAAHA
jgi:hypothetical protein